MTAYAIAFLAGTAGLVALYDRLRREFSVPAALLTTLLIFAATSLFWSMTRAISPVDAVMFGLVAAIASVTTRFSLRWPRVVAWAALGALPIVTMWAMRESAVAQTSLLSAGDPLFSVVRGFFSLTPIAYIATVGMLFYSRQQREVGVLSLLVVLVWILSSSVLLTQTREPFDHGLTAALVLLAPGLAWIIEAGRRRPWLAVGPLIAIFAIWNYWLMVQYTAGMLPKDEPVSFAAMVRQQADVHTRPPYVYPFAFPANALFAWREAVPIDRYELLVREPRRAEFQLTFDRNADRFLLDGWGPATTTADGPMRWMSSRRAGLAFPIEPSPGDIAIELLTFLRGDQPDQSADFSIELNGHDVGRMHATSVPATARVIVPAANVRQMFRERYNQLIIINLGNRRLGVSRIRIGPAS